MGEYWNREFETMVWRELHAYWPERFEGLVDYAKSNSDFHRDHLKDASSRGARSFESVTEIPFVTKSEIRDAQGSATKNMPLGSIRAVKTEDIVQVISSSGTTGRRVCHGITRNDMRPGMRNARFRSGEIDTHFIGEETGLLDDIRQDLEREGSLGVKLSQSGLSKAPVAAIAATAAVAQIMNSAGGRT